MIFGVGFQCFYNFIRLYNRIFDIEAKRREQKTGREKEK